MIHSLSNPKIQTSSKKMVSRFSSEEDGAPVELTKCSFQCGSELRRLIGKTEVFLLSCPIIRYNKYGWRNARLLVLTQDTLIIIKQKKKVKEIRLRIAYTELKGLTISLHTGSHEVVAHLEMQADVRLACHGARKHIVDTIKMFYATKTRDNLPIYGVRQQKLGIYTTQDSDVVKGISRIPLNLARLEEEDLVNIEELALRKSKCFDMPDYVETDELNQAFSSLALRKGEISPCVTDGNSSDSAVAADNQVPSTYGTPVFGGPLSMASAQA